MFDRRKANPLRIEQDAGRLVEPRLVKDPVVGQQQRAGGQRRELRQMPQTDALEIGDGDSARAVDRATPQSLLSNF